MRIGSLLTLLALLGWALPAIAAETAPAKTTAPLPPVNERFQDESITEEPSFQRHVSPLFGRLGCNGRSCHGSFQGRGGFRLSLFGYDFKADHDELLKGDPLRANKDKPLESLILVKPTDALMHEGGERYKTGGWEYHLFRRWLEAGAKYSQKDDQRIVNLEVTPAEIVFSRPSETNQLRAVAVWPDGTREDVTCLCRFTTNSEQVARISADGLVTATDPGDTHVIIAYDSAVISVPVIRPVSQLTGDRYPNAPTPTKIDELVVQKLKKLGVVQSDLSTDAEFLRRLSLDLTGTLPATADIEKFLADNSPTKRTEKIEELLKTPAYAAWWTTRLCDWTGNNDTKFNQLGTFRSVTAQAWYDWIYDRVSKNVPYDQLVEGIVTSVSRKPGESYYDYCAEMTKIYNKEDGASYASRPELPHYWGRTGFRTSEERAIGFAYTFLGIRIQCAQCHKHPFDQWAKSDFDAFKNFFNHVNIVPYGAADKDGKDDYDKILKKLGLDKSELRGNQLRNELERNLKQGKTAPFPDIAARGGRGGAAKARVLGGDEVDLTKIDDARQPVMDWLRAKDNPYFAKAFVNRVWSNYFNVGIVEPPDDLSLGNPPSNKALLNYLAQGFIDSGYDMQWVHRTIVSSRTYQLTWQPNETNANDDRNFARSVPRRLPAEVAVDAVTMALSSDERAEKFATNLTGRAIAVPGANARANQGANNRDTGFALQVFGRSIRESNCDCDRSMEASLLQTVFLQNDNAVLNAIEQPKTSWLAEVCPPPASSKGSGSGADLAQLKKRLAQAKKSGRDRAIKELNEQIAKREKAQDADQAAAKTTLNTSALVQKAYLRTLSRNPTPDELDRCLAYLSEADNPAAGAKGLLWALINTKEFIVNH